MIVADYVQPDMFKDGDAFARNTDPKTSKGAAKSMEGKPAANLQLIVLGALIKLGGQGTLADLEKHFGDNLAVRSFTPRFAPMVRHGLLTRGVPLRGPAGRMQTVWIVTQSGREQWEASQWA